jgi:type II secretory pathway pseudopilin PulG
MSATFRRIAGVVFAILVLGAAAAANRYLAASRARARHDQLAEAAESARSRTDDAIKVQLAAAEGRAASAAANPVLRAQLGIVDVATLRDGMSTEPWWEPVRKDFPVSGIAAGATPEVTIGDVADLDFSALIKLARTREHASVLLAGESRITMAAAALTKNRGQSFVVVMARPLDAPFLEEVAARARGAAMLTDGRKALLSAGPSDEQKPLADAVGRESAAILEGPDWVAAASQIGPRSWFWTFSKVRPADPGDAQTLGVWVAGAVAALVSLLLGFLGRSAPAPAPARSSAHARAQAPAAEDGDTAEDGQTIVHSDPARGAAPAKVKSAPKVKSDPKVKSEPKVSTNPTRTSPGKPTGKTSAGQRTDSGAAKSARGPVNRPKQFGRYYLIDRLGEGGMAEVFTAVAFGAENFRRAFVIKLLHGAAQRTESLVEMFIDEAKLASGLVHSNIIPVYDFGKLGDEYYMAQEYVLGRDLRRLVNGAIKADQKPLDPRLAVYVAREALRALEYAHTRQTDDGRPMGIVHRDVSPNNILASARGEVKLFDFGIAKAEEGRLHQTQTGVVKGNVQYMSPEQARGEHVDARADVYSLGLVLFFLLSGRSLYKGESAYELLIQAAQGLTPELMPRLEKLPQELAAVLRVALEPDREQRFQSAAAFENALGQMPCATSGELAREVQRLFGEELKAEQARFASVEPPPPDEEPPPEDTEEEAR